MRSARPDRRFSAAVFVGLVLLLASAVPTLENYAHNADQGLQLGMGREVLFGTVPGFDGLITYGPLVGYTSALGWWISRSLLGEAVLCTLGYATALWIVFFLVSRYTTRTAGLVAVTFGYLLLARFYKWYVWLFPLACLLAWHGYLHSRNDRRRRWAALAGAVAGVEWLYRYDLGTTGLLACLALVALFELRGSRQSIGRFGINAALLLAAFCLPLLIWFGWLAHLGGLPACRDYLSMTFLGTSGYLQAMGMSLPEFNCRAPLSAESIIVLSYAMVPLTYAVCLLIGLGAEIRGSSNSHTRILLAVAIIGLSTLHQACHRRGPYHLLQVIPPAIIGVHLLVGFFLDSPWFARRAVRFAALAYFALAIACGLGLMPFARVDMAEHNFWPRARYAALARPATSGNPDSNLLAMAKIQELAGPEQSILVFSLDSQFYALANRRMSGVIYNYCAGMYDTPAWVARNLQALRRDMPAVVVVRSDFFDPLPAEKDLLQRAWEAHHAVDQWIRANYPQVAFRRDGIMLLVRKP